MRLVRLRQLREQALLTQDELARRSGLSKSTVNRLEQGLQDARISTVRKLAAALGVSASALLDSEPGSQLSTNLEQKPQVEEDRA